LFVGFDCVVVLRLTQQRPDGNTYAYSGFFSTARRIWTQEGARAFFNGLTPCLLRVTPHSAVLLLTFEKIKGALLALDP
jgi:hypothetical protein